MILWLRNYSDLRGMLLFLVVTANCCYQKKFC